MIPASETSNSAATILRHFGHPYDESGALSCLVRPPEVGQVDRKSPSQ